MKRTMLILTVLLCALLTGCCLSHEWQEATCEVPKTCAKCGETEGEALGHSWQDAACTEAKICSVCAATEGEPLGHKDLTEANYQQAAVCGVCGEEVGEPLTPDFVKYDVQGKFVEVRETVDYQTACYDNPSMTTVGKLTVTDYVTLETDDLHPAKEGYEWKIVDVEVVFAQGTARAYGWTVNRCFEDYYDIVGHDSSSIWSAKETWDEAAYKVNWEGEEYECLARYSAKKSGWNKKTHVETWYGHYEYLVPKGYDGTVIGFTNRSTAWEEGMYIFDVVNNFTCFFRLD